MVGVAGVAGLAVPLGVVGVSGVVGVAGVVVTGVGEAVGDAAGAPETAATIKIIPPILVPNQPKFILLSVYSDVRISYLIITCAYLL